MARVGEAERPKLEVAAGAAKREAGELSVVRDLTGALARRVGPLVVLTADRDVAAQLHSPVLLRQLVEAQNAQRNAQLGAPAAGAPHHARVPVLVPIRRVVGVVEAEAVVEHAGGVDHELESAHAVAAGVEIDLDIISLDAAIAPGKSRDHGHRLIALESDPDRFAIVEHPHARLVRRSAALVRELLGERARDRRGRPGGLVELSVEGELGVGARRRQA
jgi:hypothetical protein